MMNGDRITFSIPRPHLHWAKRFLPSPGSILFTLLVVGLLVWAQSAGALPGLANSQSEIQNSQSTIPYQGRLADANGNPVTDTVNMVFRLYGQASGGGPLWEEPWTGSNGVQVSDGLFNVMLGSLNPIPQSVITGHDTLFLGITAGTDDEMTPRVQLGSVPFAVQALTVPDGSITGDKLANNLFDVLFARTTQQYWNTPCQGTHSNDNDISAIPGLSLDVQLDESQMLVVDSTGLVSNRQAGKATYTNIFIDGHRTTTPNGETLLSGCRNSASDEGGDKWCSFSHAIARRLTPGHHTIDVRIWCDATEDDLVKVHSGALRIIKLP